MSIRTIRDGCFMRSAPFGRVSTINRKTESKPDNAVEAAELLIFGTLTSDKG